MKNFIGKFINSKSLNHFVSDILNDHTDKDFEKNRTHFENFFETTDLKIIEGIGIGLPDEYLDKVAVIFSRLSMLFFSGVLLENHDGKWFPQIYFYEGKIKDIENQIKTGIQLPHLSPIEIFKTPATPLFTRLNLSSLICEKQDSCFLLQPTPDFSFLLTSRLGDPWLKNHLEQVQESLMRSFAG